MALTSRQSVDRARELFDSRGQETYRLDRIHEYLTDTSARSLPALPESAPREVWQLARAAHVNMLAFVVSARVQAMFVEGLRAPGEADNVAAWEIWQVNRFDARQIGVHRAALAYGASYVTVLPGDPVPVMRGASPRDMIVRYDHDDDWPVMALERRNGGMWRLFDDEAVYWLRETDNVSQRFEPVGSDRHGAGVTPVVRFRETHELDDDAVRGIVEPYIPLQDQINITTFGLQVAQHYGAFRQRYILGWLAETEEQRLRASSSKLWTFEDHPNDISVGEFSETNLSGYIESREATLRHLSTVSQTPAHELLGQLANLSADALAAANDSHRRAIAENEVVLGESHEQALNLAGSMMGQRPDPSSYVRWRDTESRSLAQVADALGKLVQSLGVPPQELWERVPGVSQQEVERWKAASAEGDAFAGLTALLERQASESGGQPVVPDA